MAWEENSCISLNMQLIAILSRIGVTMQQIRHTRAPESLLAVSVGQTFVVQFSLPYCRFADAKWLK